MKDKIWIKISVCIAGGAISDEYMINDSEDYGLYDNVDDAISALIGIKNVMGEGNEI